MRVVFTGLALVIALVCLQGISVRAQCSGACQDTGNWCPNAYIAGLCPGPDNIECCPEPTPSCNGQCQDNSLPCSGSYQSGLCPGPDNVQCCQASAPTSCQGACQDTGDDCPNSYIAGLCPGPDNIECCPEPTPNCNGQCQDTSLPCGGSYQSGLCPGPDNVQCCTSSGPSPQPHHCSIFGDAQWNCADVGCNTRVNAGDPQPNYACAEFAARALAAGGLLPIDPFAPQGAYANFQGYDLCWTSSRSGGGILGLEDYLKDHGWIYAGTDPSVVHQCSALFVDGGDGPYSHAVLGVGDDLCDAHNNARFHVNSGWYPVNAVWNSPSWKNTTRLPDMDPFEALEKEGKTPEVRKKRDSVAARKAAAEPRKLKPSY